MSALFYLNSVKTEAYSDAALSWATTENFKIFDIADKVGVTARAIVGAMAEENISSFPRSGVGITAAPLQRRTVRDARASAVVFPRRSVGTITLSKFSATARLFSRSLDKITPTF